MRSSWEVAYQSQLTFHLYIFHLYVKVLAAVLKLCLESPIFLILRRIAIVKNLFIASAALALIPACPVLAADLPAKTYTKAPVYVPPPVYNWTGFYVGGHICGAWSDLGSTEIAPGTGAFPAGTVFSKNNLSGFLGGVQGGFNWQANNPFVVGIEGEYSWADVSGTATTVSTAPGFAGLYQVNVVVPATVTPGAIVPVAISTSVAFLDQVTIAIQ